MSTRSSKRQDFNCCQLPTTKVISIKTVWIRIPIQSLQWISGQWSVEMCLLRRGEMSINIEIVIEKENESCFSFLFSSPPFSYFHENLTRWVPMTHIASSHVWWQCYVFFSSYLCRGSQCSFLVAGIHSTTRTNESLPCLEIDSGCIVWCAIL